MQLFSFSIFFVLSFMCSTLHSEQRIFFLHIPKTGGVSVSSMLMDHYDEKDINSLHSFLYSYGTHWYYQKTQSYFSDYAFITFLRNPIERVLSEHRYCLGLFLDLEIRSAILKAHLLPENGDPLQTASNVMCKMLSNLGLENPDVTLKDHLASAKETLRTKFFFLGITEKMEESVSLLYQKLGWEIPKKIPHHNSTEALKEQYPQQLLDEIAIRNWADIELYNYALELYEIQKNQIECIVPHPQNKHEYASQIRYSFNHPLDGYGWCVREHLDDHTTYRWASTENQADINFYLEPKKNYLFSCDLFTHPFLKNNLQITVNDLSFPLHLCEFEEPHEPNTYFWGKYRAIIPEHAVKNDGSTTFSISIIMEKNLIDLIPKYQLRDIRNYKNGLFACKEIFLSQDIR